MDLSNKLWESYMRLGDYFIQKWRMKKARDWVPTGSRILDIGCYQGEFLEYLDKQISPSVGIDPLLEHENSERHELLKISFEKRLPFPDHSFDVITLLAVIEHIGEKDIVAKEAKRLLRPGGRVVITVPSIFVDEILKVLIFFRFVDGMSLDEHHGFLPNDLIEIFGQEGFLLHTQRKFQLGLNNLFVFEKE